MEFYRITFDPSVVDLWYPQPRLLSGEAVDAEVFSTCTPYDGAALQVVSTQNGRAAPISMGSFDMPVVSSIVSDKLRSIAERDVQLIKARCDDMDACILNVLTCLECIDEERTVGEKWKEKDRRPDKLGRYRTILKLYIDSQRAVEHHIFRVGGWEVALIMSATVIATLSDTELAAMRLIPVT